jgi:exodeoxyribonuclease VII large subunit
MTVGLTLDYAQKRLISASKQQLLQKRQRYVRLTAMLDAMSPLKVLSRGYGMVRDQNGSVVKSCSSLEAGESIEVVLGDGSLSAQITEIREEIR